jgi:hypothetical protein
VSRPSNANRFTAVLVGVLALSLAACTNLNRTATLNESTHIPGARAQTTLQAELAKQGLPNATVTCAKTINVYVGPTVSCKLSSAGAHRTVKFTFKTLDGQIQLSSVKPT